MKRLRPISVSRLQSRFRCVNNNHPAPPARAVAFKYLQRSGLSTAAPPSDLGLDWKGAAQSAETGADGKHLRVCVVGSGPAGFYVTKYLLKVSLAVWKESCRASTCRTRMHAPQHVNRTSDYCCTCDRLRLDSSVLSPLYASAKIQQSTAFGYVYVHLPDDDSKRIPLRMRQTRTQRTRGFRHGAWKAESETRSC